MDKISSIKIDDFTFQSVEMENPYSTKNGKGFAQYTKDGKVYILETTFVDGKKQGVGNLKSAEGEQIEVLYFHDDEQCDENEYKNQASEVAFKPTDLNSIPSTTDKKKRKAKLKETKKKSKVVPITITTLILLVLVGILTYVVSLYVSTANQLSNGILSLKTCTQLRHIPNWIYLDVTAIKIGDGCCKGSSMADGLSFSEFVNCQSISIGENALTKLTKMDVRGMKSLQSISIGEGSLLNLSVLSMDDDDSVQVSWQWTVRSSDDIHSIPVLVSDLRFEGKRGNGIFSFTSPSTSSSTSATEVLDLSPIYNLHTLSFESNSLPHLSSLQLGNLPHLQTIDISANALQNMTTLTIYSNSLNSANLTDLDFSHLTNLGEIVIGSNSLTGVQSVKATGLSHLHSFVIGEGSLMNVKE